MGLSLTAGDAEGINALTSRPLQAPAISTEKQSSASPALPLRPLR